MNTKNFTEALIKSLMEFIGRFKLRSLLDLLKKLQSAISQVMQDTILSNGKVVENPTIKEAQDTLELARSYMEENPEYATTHLKASKTENLFTVTSFSNGDKKYRVTTSPGFTCTCMYFITNVKCCKHVFLVMSHYVDDYESKQRLDVFDFIKHAAVCFKYALPQGSSQAIMPLYMEPNVRRTPATSSQNPSSEKISHGARKHAKKGRKRKIDETFPTEEDFDEVDQSKLAGVKISNTDTGQFSVTFYDKRDKHLLVRPNTDDVEAFAAQVRRIIDKMKAPTKNVKPAKEVIGFRVTKSDSLYVYTPGSDKAERIQSGSSYKQQLEDIWSKINNYSTQITPIRSRKAGSRRKTPESGTRVIQSPNESRIRGVLPISPGLEEEEQEEQEEASTINLHLDLSPGMGPH